MLNKMDSDDRERVYDNLLDVLNDEAFALADYHLRCGSNITEDNNHLHSFILRAEKELTEYYQKFRLTLVSTNEQVYYLQAQRQSMISKARLDPLTMVIGLTIVAMQLDQATTNYEWLTTENMIERLRTQLSDARFASLVRRKGAVQTGFDHTKVMQEVHKSLMRLANLNFIQLSKDKGAFWPTNAIYRFVDPLRGLSDPAGLPDHIATLISEGYLTAPAIPENGGLKGRSPISPSPEAIDESNFDLFDDVSEESEEFEQ